MTPFPPIIEPDDQSFTLVLDPSGFFYDGEIDGVPVRVFADLPVKVGADVDFSPAARKALIAKAKAQAASKRDWLSLSDMDRGEVFRGGR
jgi:hypothetical protein